MTRTPALITLGGHRDSSLYRNHPSTPDIILAQIPRGARGAGPSSGAKRRIDGGTKSDHAEPGEFHMADNDNPQLALGGLGDIITNLPAVVSR